MPRMLATIFFGLAGSAHMLAFTPRADTLATPILTGVEDLNKATGQTKNFLSGCTATDMVVTPACAKAPGEIAATLEHSKALFAAAQQVITDATPNIFKAQAAGVVDAFGQYVNTARTLAPFLDQLGCQPAGTLPPYANQFKTAFTDQINGAESVVDAYQAKADKTGSGQADITKLRERQNDFSESYGSVKKHFGADNIIACKNL